MIIVLILMLVGIGAVIVTRQGQKSPLLEQARMQATQQAKPTALEEARRVEAEAQKAKPMAMDEAKKLQEAAELQAALGGLIAQAKSLLESGEYQEAIDTAKNILSQDANNTEAISILETATARLNELVQQQEPALMSDVPKGALNVLTTGVDIPQ